MAFYAVSYDLHKGRDYPRIRRGIESITNNWCKPLESLYIIESSKTAPQVRDFLLNHIDSDDSLFVIETKTPLNWDARKIPKECADWLK
ncbi:hypothetical protein ACG9Y4_04685 [Acinetobacter guillouiae]|uniref:hypothetical protein n=1 Tax=Acinetobacter guillouiae TaxID=106649 RepID=UPI003AF993C9